MAVESILQIPIISHGAARSVLTFALQLYIKQLLLTRLYNFYAKRRPAFHLTEVKNSFKNYEFLFLKSRSHSLNSSGLNKGKHFPNNTCEKENVLFQHPSTYKDVFCTGYKPAKLPSPPNTFLHQKLCNNTLEHWQNEMSTFLKGPGGRFFYFSSPSPLCSMVASLFLVKWGHCLPKYWGFCLTESAKRDLCYFQFYNLL